MSRYNMYKSIIKTYKSCGVKNEIGIAQETIIVYYCIVFQGYRITSDCFQ